MAQKIFYIAALSLLSACSGYNGEKAQQQRDDWQQSLQDSIATLRHEYAADSVRVEELRLKVGSEIEAFTTVDNPREVEPYYIYGDWNKRYPLTTTGLVARILKSESLELVAASKSRFSAIRVSADGQSAETEVVPADQALNYTAGGLTTVAFSGAKADSVAMIIADASSPVKVEYLNPGVAATITLPAAQQEMISKTWSLYSAQRDIHRLQNKMNLDSRKIEIIKLTVIKNSK